MKLMDSHIHLWPQLHLGALTWISPDNLLYSQYSINEYVKAIEAEIILTDDHRGFIFVEADRKYSFNPIDWTEPIKEFKYALSIYRGEGREGCSDNGKMLRGFVGWAPVPLGAEGMRRYITELRELCASDSELRGLLKGFRYLIQNKPLGTCIDEQFVDGVRWCGQNGYTFDLCVDFQNCGKPQLDETLRLVQQVPETVYLIGSSIDTIFDYRSHGEARFKEPT